MGVFMSNTHLLPMRSQALRPPPKPLKILQGLRLEPALLELDASPLPVMPMKPHPRHQSGFSLVEILLVLGLVATIAVGAFVIYPRVQMSMDINKTLSKYHVIVAGTREFFGNRPYTGLSITSSQNAGIFTAEELKSPWGTMAPTVSADPSEFYVIFNDIPPDVCKKLLARLDEVSPQLHTDAGGYLKDATTAFNPLTSVASCDTAATHRIRAWAPR